MSTLPSGTVTFMFTDIEGSTRLWEESRDQMRAALERHDAILSQIIERHSGYTFKTVGDAYCAVFQRAVDAATAAVDIQRAVGAETWDLPRPVRVRIGVHTGEAHERNNDYYGQVVNRVARLEASAHGGQTVVSAVTHEIVRDQVPDGVRFRDLGQHRLKDLTRPQTVFQLEADGLPTDFPPLASLDRHAHNLPVQTTPFIGRQETLESLRSLVTDGDHRIVSILGPGGMGKTRIALQVAGEEIDRFDDGAWFVDLSSARDELGFYSAIAEAVGPGGERSSLSKADVLSLLRDKRMLLILDNFEQLADLAPVVSELASTGDGLHFLVTTRVALRIRGETVFDLPPLSMPDERESEPVEALGQYEAVKLFIDRAEAVSSSFVIDRTNAPAVAAICHRLDGIPLAIELAAARARMLAPQAILDRLTNRLKLLTGGSRDLPTRQQTLRHTIDWSYELLDEPTRRAFAALGAFDGLIRLPAAEAVLAAIGMDEAEALDRLQSLVDQSLLVVVPIEEETPTFAMLETIHEYAAEALDNSELGAAVRDAHAEYFGRLSVAILEHIDGADQADWIRAGWAEIENVRGATRWLATQPVGERYARPALGLARLLAVKGLGSAGVDLLRDVDFAELTPTFAVRAACEAADLARVSGRREDADRFLAAVRGHTDASSDATIRAYRAFAGAVLADDPANAEQRYREALASGADASNDVLQGRARVGLEQCALRAGDLDAALEHNELARSHFAHVGDRRRLALCDSNRGISLYMKGHLEPAREAFRSAIEQLSVVGDVEILCLAYSNLATVDLALERPADAEREATLLLQTAKNVGDRRFQAMALGALAEASQMTGSLRAAVDTARAGLDRLGEDSEGQIGGYIRRVLGTSLAELGKRETAVSELSRAIKIFERSGDHDELEKARAALQKAESVGR